MTFAGEQKPEIMQAHHLFPSGEPIERITNGLYRPILFQKFRGIIRGDWNRLAIHPRSSRHSVADQFSEQSL